MSLQRMEIIVLDWIRQQHLLKRRQ